MNTLLSRRQIVEPPPTHLKYYKRDNNNNHCGAIANALFEANMNVYHWVTTINSYRWAYQARIYLFGAVVHR